jgi:hypothetical protein
MSVDRSFNLGLMPSDARLSAARSSPCTAAPPLTSDLATTSGAARGKHNEMQATWLLSATCAQARSATLTDLPLAQCV